MGVEASKKEEREPIIIEIVDYENIDYRTANFKEPVEAGNRALVMKWWLCVANDHGCEILRVVSCLVQTTKSQAYALTHMWLST